MCRFAGFIRTAVVKIKRYLRIPRKMDQRGEKPFEMMNTLYHVFRKKARKI